MDQEQLEILKRYVNVKKPGNRIDQMAEDYGLTTKEMKARIRELTEQLIKEYELMKGGQNG